METFVVLPSGREVNVDGCAHLSTCRTVGMGDVVEWRIRSGAAQPHALFVRLFPDERSRRNSHLVVMRLFTSFACVVGVVPAVRGQTDRARALADRNAPCL